MNIPAKHDDPPTFEVDVIEYWREGRNIFGDPLLGVVVVVVVQLDMGVKLDYFI